MERLSEAISSASFYKHIIILFNKILATLKLKYYNAIITIRARKYYMSNSNDLIQYLVQDQYSDNSDAIYCQVLCIHMEQPSINWDHPGVTLSLLAHSVVI